MPAFYTIKFIISFFILTFFSNVNMPVFANDAQFIAKEHIVIDLKSGVEWLRCSVGQRWNGAECIGEIVKLNQEMAGQAIKLANEQLGGNWRLPNRKELESIVCFECGKVKINKEFFPNTPYEPFWTGEKNSWSKQFYWSVNFFTGHTFGRFPGNIPNFVRLVRSR